MPRVHNLISGTILEHPNEPAYVMDPQHDRILAANDAGCAMLGYTREELLERALLDGRASTIKLTRRTKPGTFLPTEISLHGFEAGGRLQILGLVQDRSEHRQPAPDWRIRVKPA